MFIFDRSGTTSGGRALSDRIFLRLLRRQQIARGDGLFIEDLIKREMVGSERDEKGEGDILSCSATTRG
ncbi:hypothetical protein DPMN_125686 [Dreissena polymorpha]|uniref:Uncharacterized protein n=1 Tax=Dreissena polymorpha TaxID=45954 RepID=A0A9D4JXF3_DREPO|nr:hypothetical protein DPMN_125686 [Dreissena polymorpha]